MKRNIALALAASSLMLVSLLSTNSSVRSQQVRKIITFDTGVVTLGPNQVLRLTVASGDFNNDGDTTVGFRGIKYEQGGCGGGVCQLANAGVTATGPYTLAAGEAVSLELVATTYGRGIVSSNRKNVRVTASIINTVTGDTTSHIIMANTEGDFH
jgi:hypothetical protein